MNGAMTTTVHVKSWVCRQCGYTYRTLSSDAIRRSEVDKTGLCGSCMVQEKFSGTVVKVIKNKGDI